MPISRYSVAEEGPDVLRKCYHIAKADFLDRIRNRRLLAVIAVSIYLGHVTTVGDIQLVLGDPKYRGVYNSAWIGTVMALAASAAIALFGFYLVKDALARDFDGGPDQLVASSITSDFSYLLGKWTSNLAVLSILMAVMATSVAVLLGLRGTGPVIFTDILLPFVLITFPIAALVAAVAVLFESTRVLRGSIGNVVYFFGIVLLFTVPSIDALGASLIKESMETALMAQHSAYEGGNYAFGTVSGDVGTFQWDGLDVTRDLLVHRIGFLLVSVGIVVTATVPFRRFDPSSESALSVPGQSWLSSVLSVPSLGRTTDTEDSTVEMDASEASVAGLARFDGSNQSMRPLGLLRAELRMAVRDRSMLWYLGAAILIGGGLLAGAGGPTGGVLTIAWIWPIFVWSEMGAREHLNRTESLVFSSSYPLAQLAATWVVGVLIAAVFVLPAIASFAISGEFVRMLGPVVGVLFVPSMALAAGVVSESSRLFEIGYLLLWYLGPANQTASIDYSGATAAPTETLVGFSVAAVALLGGAVLVRRRRLQ